jgi:hypothetical protein
MCLTKAPLANILRQKNKKALKRKSASTHDEIAPAV